MAFDNAKFLNRFVEEAREHCSRISEGLLNLEHASGDGDAVNALFRSAHTVKGAARMLKLTGVTELAHRMEDLLDAVRGGGMQLTPPLVDLLFRGTDALLAMLDRIAAGDTAPVAPGPLCAELSRSVAAGDAAGSPAVAAAQAASVTEPVPAEGTHAAAPVRGQGDYLRVSAMKLDDLIHLMGEIVSEQSRFRKELQRLQEIERSLSRYRMRLHKDLCAASGAVREELQGAGDSLQGMLRESVRDLQRGALMQEQLIGELRGTSLKMRMLPLSTVFDPLRRTFRDLARESGKEIDLVVQGGETELDRKVIDRVGDCLVHLISNAVNHGIEAEAERIAAGKPVRATVTLSACYDGGCAVIALSDDGKGLALDRIREKALAKGLVDAETLAAMPRSEIIDLIFRPGFSTSQIITDRAGRGVGMDVVRKSVVDELKGTIVVDTREGMGTSFLLRLPLNLAVFPVLQVAVEGKVCALPATCVVEMVRSRSDRLLQIVDRRALTLREQLIPVEPLAAILALSRHEPEPGEVLIVIVRDGAEKLGLIVDDVIGSEDMVIKPLPDHLQNLKLVSGVMIGDRDTVINLLHVPELLRLARKTAPPGRREAPPPRDVTILVVDDSFNTREIERSILEAGGYLVDTAFDGEDAFSKTRDRLYDLIVTDVEMPRLDGFSLTERLRGDERYRTVPIIMVTSRDKEEDKKRGISVGADAYIVKGAFDQSHLMDTVQTLVD